MVILISLYLFILSLLFALLEIEIEGKSGWAEKLPTWYRKYKILSLFGIKKPLTGYHLITFSFLLLIFHSIFFFGLTWSLQKELQIISYYLIFLVLEDLLWFIFNPKYGINKFKKSKIWWHSESTWFLGLFPLSYLFALVISLTLSFISSSLLSNYSLFLDHIFILILIFVWVLSSSILFSSLYKSWNISMRKNDDRKKFHIFR